MSVERDDFIYERLGHASVRIETPDGTVVYVDPWSEVLDGSPGDADVVFVTHDDRDHYDPDAVHAVASDATVIAAYEAIDTSDLDRSTVSLPADGEVMVEGIAVRTVSAYNRPDGEHLDDDGNPYHAPGEVVGLLLSTGSTTIYYPSDTDFLEDHADLSADVFIPPIGGHFTMDRHEAADFARSVDPDLILPVHYDTFEPIETDAEAFAAELNADGIAVVLF